MNPQARLGTIVSPCTVITFLSNAPAFDIEVCCSKLSIGQDVSSSEFWCVVMQVLSSASLPSRWQWILSEEWNVSADHSTRLRIFEFVLKYNGVGVWVVPLGSPTILRLGTCITEMKVLSIEYGQRMHHKNRLSYARSTCYNVRFWMSIWKLETMLNDGNAWIPCCVRA